MEPIPKKIKILTREEYVEFVKMGRLVEAGGRSSPRILAFESLIKNERAYEIQLTYEYGSYVITTSSGKQRGVMRSVERYRSDNDVHARKTYQLIVKDKLQEGYTTLPTQIMNDLVTIDYPAAKPKPSKKQEKPDRLITIGEL